jgi:hypothetical protein
MAPSLKTETDLKRAERKVSTASYKLPRSAEVGPESEYVGRLIFGLKDHEEEMQRKDQIQVYEACFLAQTVHSS